MNVVLAARLMQVLIALARCAVWPVPQTPSRSNQCPQTEVDFDENRIAVVISDYFVAAFVGHGRPQCAKRCAHIPDAAPLLVLPGWTAAHGACVSTRL